MKTDQLTDENVLLKIGLCLNQPVETVDVRAFNIKTKPHSTISTIIVCDVMWLLVWGCFCFYDGIHVDKCDCCIMQFIPYCRGQGVNQSWI